MTEEQKQMIDDDIRKIEDAREEQNILWLNKRIDFMVRKYSEFITDLEDAMVDTLPNDPDFQNKVDSNAKLLVRKMKLLKSEESNK